MPTNEVSSVQVDVEILPMHSILLGALLLMVEILPTGGTPPEPEPPTTSTNYGPRIQVM